VSSRRKGDTLLDWLSLPDVTWFDDLIGTVVAVVGFVLLAVILFTIVFPLIALTLELVLFVVLFTAGLIGRLLFGRPWRIEARTIGVPHKTREVYAKGLRGSREAIDELATAIASGR
jgi:hypothetical protein